jgi:hypothetical protein
MLIDQFQEKVTSLFSKSFINEANSEVDSFLKNYLTEKNANLASRLELARVSYLIAYDILPKIVYSDWNRFCVLWASPLAFPFYLAIKGAHEFGVHLTGEQIEEFKYYQGDISEGIHYFILEYPTPPMQTDRPSVEELLAMLENKSKASLELIPVLGPFFSAIIVEEKSCKIHIYVLGQSPDNQTTLRSISSSGINANCGNGCEPSACEFLERLKLLF